ncbi:hypothetical protein OBBRIDRAFT_792815 [Obba rivulosa]|uniref:Zinc-finger domain-containing protein n=1 Tax=Obba rivulosa TaxID=1052685 RepID=A0A8E2ATW9_9APHY|nr:hypothetical protein OBBRIDRAFT_792815 [Obba rivulosa]
MDVDESYSREEGEIEEGEISDSEPPPSAPVPAAPLSASTQNVRQSSLEKSKPLSDSTPATVKIEPVPSPISRGLMSSIVMTRPPMQNGATVLPLVLDANHVRPGLTMTQEEYDAAKDIVLDLLGWGVPPEYLVNCGLSREIVYYVFVELNLRLPSNLDTSGIPPFQPLLAQPRLPPTSVQPQPTESAVPLASRLDSRSPERIRRPSFVSPPGAAGPSSLSAAAPVFTPSSPSAAEQSPSGPSLSDMELQRRQELLARKAILASRRVKQQALGSSSTPTDEAGPLAPAKMDPTDVAMAIAEDVPIPTKTVDDFLKTIEPVSSKEKRPAPSTLSFIPADLSGAMDVDDESIPGLSVTEETWTSASSLPSASSTTSMFTSGSGTPTSVVPPSSTSETSPKGETTLRFGAARIVELHRSSAAPSDDDEIPGLSIDEGSPADADLGPPGPRSRVAKRPVAADFVDMEPGSLQVQMSNGHGVNPYRQATSRRKTGSFAGLSGMRRCVINLSDSEDEVEESIYGENGGFHPPRGPPTYQPPSRSSSRAGMWTSRLNGSPEATPSGQATPDALLEKELEIKRMRELIQQREQNRLRKLAAASRKSTPPFASSSDKAPAQLTATPPVKEEEDELMAAASLRRSHNADSPYTPSNGNTTGNDAAEEQNVLSTVLPIARQSTGTPSIYSRDSASVSTSSVTTPTDLVPISLEHPTTGDRVLTDEARQEQVVGMDTSSADQQVLEDAVGVPEACIETPTQIIDTQASSERPRQEDSASPFIAYTSPLDSYPLLRSHSHSLSDATNMPSPSIMHHMPSSSTSPIQHKNFYIDLTPLKTARVKSLFSDPSRRLCQYEVPGGGECRDPHCEDIHLSRTLSAEPTDEEIAQYLHSAVSGGAQHSVGAVKKALEDARQLQPAPGLEGRVLHALAALGLR